MRFDVYVKAARQWSKVLGCISPTYYRTSRLQAGTRGDRYANLSLGNIYFSNLEDRTKYEKHLLHAANFYHEVLKKDDANAFSGRAYH